MVYLNLVPSNLWYLNLRKLLSESEWSKLSTKVRDDQHWVCQACGISIKQLKATKWFDCHEMWQFDDETHEIKLACLMCICKKCHTATHFGLAMIKNRDQSAFTHLCKVNKWDKESAQVYIEACFEQWSQRSQKTWTMNWESFEPWLDKDLIAKAKAAYLDLNK